MIKIITSTDNREKCFNLERSLNHFGHDYHIIVHHWDGFLSKLFETYKFLKSLDGYTHFLYTDAWDTFCLKKDIEVPDGLLISAERACYPHPEKSVLYPDNPSPWKYVNGGGWCGEIAAFIKMFEANKPSTELNDQVYLTDEFLKKRDWINLDYNCEIFQTIAFCPESDFEIEGERVRNTVTNTYPAFFHGNGHTPMDWVYKVL